MSRRSLVASSVFATFACMLIACGSSSNEAAPGDAQSDSQNDAGSDTRPETKPDAPVDTGRVPKAPRCKEIDAGTPDASPEVGADAGDDGSFDATDAGDDGGDSGDAGDAGDAGEVGETGGPTVYAMPEVLSSGGRVLRNPRVIPITFAGDYNRDDVEDFVASFGCTAYWRAISREYGVGDAVGGTPIHVADPAPDAMSDRQIELWLKKNIEAKTPGWELPGPDTLYAVYYPASTSVTLGRSSESCVDFGGFHKSFTLTDGTRVAYAVNMDCEGSSDEVTAVSSHEFIEAATDPFPDSAPAYQFPDPDHFAYALQGGGEVGDMCVREEAGGQFFPSDYPFMVQRSWSNAASRTMHDPCVPAIGDVYFNTIPSMPDRIPIGFFSIAETAGVKIALGSSSTIKVRLFADGPLDAWTVSAKDVTRDGVHLAFSFDKTSGVSGDEVSLTITRKSESKTYGFEIFGIYSTKGKYRHVSYGLVSGP